MNSTTVLPANTIMLSSTATLTTTTGRKKKEEKGMEVNRRMEGGIVVSRVEGKKVELW